MPTRSPRKAVLAATSLAFLTMAWAAFLFAPRNAAAQTPPPEKPTATQLIELAKSNSPALREAIAAASTPRI